jgi:hypothetical protein
VVRKLEWLVAVGGHCQRKRQNRVDSFCSDPLDLNEPLVDEGQTDDVKDDRDHNQRQAPRPVRSALSMLMSSPRIVVIVGSGMPLTPRTSCTSCDASSP